MKCKPISFVPVENNSEIECESSKTGKKTGEITNLLKENVTAKLSSLSCFVDNDVRTWNKLAMPEYIAQSRNV